MRLVRAPAKLNVCLFVGGTRDDGLHEICSVFVPLTLADHLELSPAEADAVECDAVEGPNLAADALAALRTAGWAHEPLRVMIDKRIPVAAGLAGGSADAAAVLRLAADQLGGIEEIAAGLGADVPSQLRPAPYLVGGAGEALEPIAPPAPFGVVLIPGERGLSAAEVYAEADRLGTPVGPGRLTTEREAVRALVATEGWTPADLGELARNDLEPAARSLRPEIDLALAALRDVGASVAMVTGSGPTVFGVFEDLVAADRAVSRLGPRHSGAIVAAAVPGEAV